MNLLIKTGIYFSYNVVLLAALAYLSQFLTTYARASQLGEESVFIFFYACLMLGNVAAAWLTTKHLTQHDHLFNYRWLDALVILTPVATAQGLLVLDGLLLASQLSGSVAQISALTGRSFLIDSPYFPEMLIAAYVVTMSVSFVSLLYFLKHK